MEEPFHYYNEIDPFAAAWLRELIRTGHLPQGYVDERDIREVQPTDLDGFTQCHFFAGIGVWPHALHRARWPEDRPVWTGSCPCQPFSGAGKRGGTADERHLWPAFYHLIAECRPAAVFGEQVASKDGLAWLDTVHADLEGAGYAVGAADTCAAGFGAPHIRQRLYFVAESNQHQRRQKRAFASRSGEGSRAEGLEQRLVHGGDGELGHAEQPGLEGYAGYGDSRNEPKRLDAGAAGSTPASGHTNGFWRDAEWLPCRDQKYRPVEPGTFPLAHGAANRVGRLRGYGNALVAPQAVAFIEAYLEVTA